MICIHTKVLECERRIARDAAGTRTGTGLVSPEIELDGDGWLDGWLWLGPASYASSSSPERRGER